MRAMVVPANVVKSMLGKLAEPLTPDVKNTRDTHVLVNQISPLWQNIASKQDTTLTLTSSQ